jgi:hypothetical protein
MCRQIRDLIVLNLLIGSLAAAEAEQGWWFRGGALYRGGISYRLEGTSILETEGRSAVETGVRSPAADVGPANAPANRRYDDGFVNVDPATADSPGFLTPNLTTHWGYQSNTQRSGRDLTFTRSGPQGLRRLGEESRTLNEKETLGAPGVEFLAGKPIRITEESRWDWIGGLRVFVPGSQTVRGTSRTENFQGQIVQITDTYRLDDILIFDGTTETPNPPPAPFTGSPGSQIVRNAIPNIPANRTIRTLAAGEWQAETDVSAEVDVTQFELRFGAEWSRGLGENWRLNVQPSVSAHILDVDVSRRESVIAQYADGSRETLFTLSENKSSTEVLFGVGLQAGVSRPLSENWGLDLTLGYDYVTESSLNIGANTVKLDFSAYTVGLAFRRGFGGGAK